MFFKLSSFSLVGIQAIEIFVEIHISNGLPTFTIVGLPDKAVNESRQRVRAAIINSGFKFPPKKITINLSPADIKKEGVFYDLPIAIAILIASEQVKNVNFTLIEKSSFIGELSLDGKINSIRGIICMAEQCRNSKKEYFFIPKDNLRQASCIKGINLISSTNLIEVINIITNKSIENIFIDNFKDIGEDGSFDLDNLDISFKTLNIDFSDIKGQSKAKRAIEIAASGMHNILLVGPPGAGKTMLAQRIITIMPELNLEESIEVTKIYSLYKKYKDIFIKIRPFRNPHHTVSRASLIGGGIVPKPGEISLAHRGVLFLDEFSQFPKYLIEDLRQPLENKEIIISRNNLFYKFPCNFMLVLATNPCACGYFQDSAKKCKCSTKEIENYWKNISGPIMDRIDMRINVPRLDYQDFFKKLPSENSQDIKARINEAHKIQKIRYKNIKNLNINFNSEADSKLVNQWVEKNSEIKKTVLEVFNTYKLSGRAMASLLKVSRTIADLDMSTNIKTKHFMEALNYRVNFNSEI